MPNKSYAYLLNVESINLKFLKTYNTQFAEIVIKYSNQNGWPLRKLIIYHLSLIRMAHHIKNNYIKNN